MGYQIRYDTVVMSKPKKSSLGSWLVIGALLLLVAGAAAVRSAWLPWVREVLLPGDPAVTAAALETMVAQLKGGQSITEAAAAFCREILAHAG